MIVSPLVGIWVTGPKDLNKKQCRETGCDVTQRETSSAETLWVRRLPKHCFHVFRT